jgi:probable HAF family extracellular repeat protein
MKRQYNSARSARHAAIVCMLFGGIPVPTFAQARVPVQYIPTYTLTDLSEQALSQGATVFNRDRSVYSEAFAINNAGQAVGIFKNISSSYHGFRTQPNAPIDYLSSFDSGSWAGDDLFALPGTARSAAFAVNNSGVAVGESGNYIFGEDGAGFCSISGLPLEDLGLNNADYTHPTGINDSGWIVGYFLTGGQIHSFLRIGGGPSQMVDSWYGSPRFSQILAVNNSAQLVGRLSDTGNDGIATAFLWNYRGVFIPDRNVTWWNMECWVCIERFGTGSRSFGYGCP